MRKAWNKIDWTDERSKFLKENFNTMSNKQIADSLGLKITAVRHKCYELGLYKMTLEYWTDEQVDFLLKNYKEKGDTELAEIFNEKWHKDKGWTKKHIEKKRRYLKLKRTPEEIAKIHLGHIKKGVYVEGNKKMWETRGCRKYGEEVVWYGQKFTKIEKGYIHTRIFNYKKYVGEIPKGMMVRHKDGNQLNCSPENLLLVSRADHARLNNASRCPPEWRETMVLLRKLNLNISRKLKRNEFTRLKSNTI